MRKYHRNKSRLKPLYDFEPWQLTEKEFKIEHNHHNEAIFALGNGYMGVRGTLEEDYSGPVASTTPGVYINGVYASEEIIYGEEAPDLPQRGQTMANLTNWTRLNFFFDEEKFDILTGKVEEYRRTLNFKEGTLRRELVWTSPGGKKLKLSFLRFVSLTQQHIGVIQVKFIPLNFSGKIRVSSALEGDVQNYHHLREKKVLRTLAGDCKEGKAYLLQKIESTNFYIAAASKHELNLAENAAVEEFSFQEAENLIQQFAFTVQAGQEYSLVKYASLYSQQGDNSEAAAKATAQAALQKLEVALNKGWQELLAEQKAFLEDYWADADVKIFGDTALQQAFRFNAFHLLQSTGRDGRTSIAAKGLTGEFYEGHYFWDTETYVLPFYLYSKPELARKLLLFRYNTLNYARENARRMKLAGALFPWRTINGQEASGFFMGSTVQYHIDADIAYAIYQYYQASGDEDFYFNYGVEILVETARMWASRGSYIPLKGNKFCFNEVCGPDEYKPGVNNNCYTNYMAKFNLEIAAQASRQMAAKVPGQWQKLKDKLALTEEEIGTWEKIAADIYLPYNEELGIHPQDDSFLYKDPIDVDEIPLEEIPLVKNWHPLIIWRYQVIKQADVILLMLLLGDQFTLQEKKANYDFYEAKTTHDSSLSPAIYSIIASEIGYQQEAYDYFLQTARLDLDDYNDNAYQGVHTACMAGSWLALTHGFAGMRNYHGQLHLNPYLPAKWQGYEFKIKFQGKQLLVSVDREGVLYKLLKGEELKFFHRGQELSLKHGEIKKII